MNNKIKKTIFTLKLQGIYIREVIKIIKERYGYDNKEYIEKIYKECKKRNDYYHKGSNIPKDLYESFLRIATKCYDIDYFLRYINKKYGYNISQQSIRINLSKKGYKRNKRSSLSQHKVISKKEHINIINLYKNGKSSVQIAKQYNCNHKTILDILKKYNVERNNSYNKEYNIDFTMIDNTFKAYYLGLLLTDGYITSNRSDVSIQLKDLDVIEFIANKTNSTYFKVSQNMYRTSVYGKQYRQQLERLGVVENKSLILQGPNLYKEEEQFIPYILRGIIDGDGWIRKDGKEFFICSASYDFIMWCKKQCETLGMKEMNITFSDNMNNGIYYLRTAKKENLKILKNVIYDIPYGMQRKYCLLHEGSETIIKTSQVDDGIVQTTTNYNNNLV